MDEKEKEIISLHALLYDYLMSIHEKDPNFRFRVRRMNNQNRLEKGYWFNGNLSYLETSFWDYKDNLHQTPVIRLCYGFDIKKWFCELVGRDNRERESYFRKMGDELGFFSDNRTPIWRKELQNSNADFLEPIKHFITNDKIKIDAYLGEHAYNKSLIGFIEKQVFEKDNKRIFTNKEKIEDTQQEKIVEETKETIKIPYSLSSLSVENFQGIDKKGLRVPQEDLTSIPVNTQWIFLTGENGFGKTSILRAAAIGLAGDEMGVCKNLEPVPEIKVEGIKNGIYYSNFKEDNEEFEEFENVVAYGVSRFLTEESIKKEILNKTASLFKDDERLLSIEDVLQKNEKRFEEIRDKLIKVMPNIVKITRLLDEKGYPQILFYEKDEQGKVFNEGVTLNKLGAGYRGIFTMMGDMILRLSNDLEKNVNNIEGVVLIDEIDAHLHPKYQYELPKLFSEAFPKVQFIVSTHSPIPILGLPKDVKSVVLTVNRTVENGITVERLDDDIDIKRLSANALLTSDIFGFQTIFARGATAETIQPFDNYEDIKEMTELEKTLKLKEGFKKLRIKA